MNYNEYIEAGLNGEAPLKIIMRGSVVDNKDGKVGVVSVIYATMDKAKAKDKLEHLVAESSSQSDYYMVYSVPLDTDLAELAHYPSIAISKNDLI